MVRDIRMALRALLNRPAFTVVAVLTLALGIGANTAVYTVSPDGRKVAFAALRDGAWNLQRTDVHTGERGELGAPVPPSVYARYPEWSPRGGLVVYERGELRGNIWLLAVR